MTIEVGGSSGGGLPQLAPDLTYPASKVSAAQGYSQIIVPVVAGVETTTLNLSGKWAVYRIWYLSLTTEVMHHYMENDGIVIWDDDGATASSFSLYGFQGSQSNAFGGSGFEVKTDLTLKITTITDTSVTINIDARPIV